MKKEEPYDSIRGGKAIVVHLGAVLDFYQCSQGPEVCHLICCLPISKMLGDIPLSPVLPSTHVVDTLFGQFPTTLIVPCSVYGINSRNMHYFAKFKNLLGVNFLLSDNEFRVTCPFTILLKISSPYSKVFVECKIGYWWGWGGFFFFSNMATFYNFPYVLWTHPH